MEEDALESCDYLEDIAFVIERELILLSLTNVEQRGLLGWQRRHAAWWVWAVNESFCFAVDGEVELPEERVEAIEELEDEGGLLGVREGERTEEWQEHDEEVDVVHAHEGHRILDASNEAVREFLRSEHLPALFKPSFGPKVAVEERNTQQVYKLDLHCVVLVLQRVRKCVNNWAHDHMRDFR